VLIENSFIKVKAGNAYACAGTFAVNVKLSKFLCDDYSDCITMNREINGIAMTVRIRISVISMLTFY